MKHLSVIYQGWGEKFHLGDLAETGNTLMFEYTQDALNRGLQISPLKLPLRTEGYAGFPGTQYRLPGVVADSLPDGWGMLLMDRLFKKHQQEAPAALDRLAFIQNRAMGALSFEPGANATLSKVDVDLLQLAQDAQLVLSERESAGALRELALIGGSPHGARPKVLLNYDPQTGRVYGSENMPGAPWLFKFPAQNEHKEVAETEALYAELARIAGLEMPEVVAIDLATNLSAFGIRRFDRERGMRVPMLTVAGAMDLNFRELGILDYNNLLRITRAVTRDEREVNIMFERCVFNVVFNNRDDHAKNFSFRMGSDGNWRVAPCYDLTFNRGPGGYHQMDVAGEAKAPRRADLMRLATLAGIPKAFAENAIDRILDVASQFKSLAGNYCIRKTTVTEMAGIVATNQNNLMR
jgi:serine/threonine-protein kinase HipA